MSSLAMHNKQDPFIAKVIIGESKPVEILNKELVIIAFIAAIYKETE
jgi:hypothetical protein